MYRSTRGQAPLAGFDTVIRDGLAPDGGLYVPERVVPFTPAELADARGLSLIELTGRIVVRFGGDAARVPALLARAHDGFTHPAVVPLVQTGADAWVMELFHGPTLAFKDLAMQVLAPLMGDALARAGRTATIIGATSGDTGGAALAAFAGVPGVRALFLYPQGGVSAFQAAQMAALSRPDLRAVPVTGSFDDCQRIVKSLLAGGAVPRLTAVNSVNWGRILAQSAYYAFAALRLGSAGTPVNFAVPTGNFGNVYAAILARRLGFAVGSLVVATNANETVHQLVHTGRAGGGPVVPTLSPAMDIKVPSNLERLIHDLGADGAQVRDLFGGAGAMALPGDLHAALRATVLSAAVSDDETLAQMRAMRGRTGYVADPHTAVALAAAGRVDLPPGPVVVLATAHPVKFRETVARALGGFPAELDRPVPTGGMPGGAPIPAEQEAVGALLDAVARA